jgi:hypothetical protein
VRFAIAYERADCTTHEAAMRTGLRADIIQSWLRARVFPDVRSIAALAHAVEQLEAFAVSRESNAGAPAARVSRPRPERRAPAPVPPSPSEHASESTPSHGAHDILVGMASMSRGLRVMRRSGWCPDDAARAHCAEIARTFMDIGGLTAEDLAPRRPVVVGGGAASLDALFGGRTEDEQPAHDAPSRAPRRPNGGRR